MLTSTGTSAAEGSRSSQGPIFMASDRVEAHDGVGELLRALLGPMGAAAVYPELATHVDVGDVGAAAADDERVHERVGVVAAQGRGIPIQYHEVGPLPGCERAHRLPKSLGAAAAGGLPERDADAIGGGEARALLHAQALAVFQETQFLHGVDAAVAVGAYGNAPARRRELVGGEQAIAEVGLGDGAEHHARAAGAYRSALLRGGVGRMHQVPAGTELHGT